MKEKYYLRNGCRATIHAFRTGDFSGADMISEKNGEIMRELYRRLQESDIDYFYIASGKHDNGHVYLFTRDAVYSRGTGIVKVSVIWRKGNGENTEFIPLSHHRFNTLCEYMRYGTPHGWVHVRRLAP